MSADLLRRAASLMRELAEAARSGPWEAVEGSSGSWWVELRSTADVAADIHGPDAHHIASWHPAVALAVADWLEATAERIDAGREPVAGGRRNHGWRGSQQALAVARAYLGEDA